MKPKRVNPLRAAPTILLLLGAPAVAAQDSTPPGPPSMTSIMVKATARCLVSIGPDHEKLLDPGTFWPVFLPAGDYEIVARDPESGRVLWQDTIDLQSGRAEVVRIDLPNDDPPHSGPVFHGKGGLDWTREETRDSVSWEEARAYCSSFAVGEVQDWRLPTREESEGLCRDQFDDPTYQSGAIGAAGFLFWTSSKSGPGAFHVIALEPGCEVVTWGASERADVVCVRSDPERQEQWSKRRR